MNELLGLSVRPLTGTDSETNDLFTELISKAKLKKPMAFFGNETSHAYHLSENKCLDRPDLARGFFLRPACEPIILSHFEQFKANEFDVDKYVQFASVLTLQHIKLRGLKNAKLVLDENEVLETHCTQSPAEAISSILQMVKEAGSIDSRFFIDISARTILIQPLVNSNSRTVTAFLNLALMKKFSLCGPPISIGPSYVVRPQATFHALRELYNYSNWLPFSNLFKQALKDSIFVMNCKFDYKQYSENENSADTSELDSPR
jgi:hypothetical protein